MTVYTLYRFFDADGALLYVGRTVNAGRRWREHEKRAPWFDEVKTVTREILATAEALALAERQAITTEQPLHNIALNAGRVIAPPRRPKVAAVETDTFLRRLNSLPDYGDDREIQAEGECLGDETACECVHCHERRLSAFEDLRAKYDWHPDIDAEINAVEALYYGGAYLFDWYYELFDVEMFARMRLASESRSNPIPAYFEFSDTQVAVVECPFCFVNHRHVLTSGTALSRAVESGCERAPLGMYRLEDDWPLLRDLLITWGESSAKKAGVA